MIRMPSLAFACFALAYPNALPSILVTSESLYIFRTLEQENEVIFCFGLAPGSYRDRAVEVKWGLLNALHHEGIVGENQCT